MSVNHWNTLAEAQKLTQSQLLPGVIEEDIKRENLVDRMPTALATGKSIKWNREKKVLEDDVADFTTGDQTSWTSSMEYDQQETELKQKYIARLLDSFIAEVYGTINNYEAQVLWECKKGMYRRLGKDVLYNDITYGGALQFDGLHALAAVQTGTNLDIDEGGALSLQNLRLMLNAMKAGVDILYVPAVIGIRLDAAYEERGFTSLKADTAGAVSLLTRGIDQLGKPILYFAGVPIVRTDYLVAEDDGTGDGSNVRGRSSSAATYSIFGIKFGNLFKNQPGLMMAFGAPDMTNKLYRIEHFEKMENYVASGLRLTTWTSPLLGSKLCLGRIFDITDAVITA